MMVGLLSPAFVTAAESRPLNIQTSPLPINLITDPGKSVTTDLRVKQAGGQTERLQVSLMKFAAFGQEGKPRLIDREPGDDYFDWVKFDKTSFEAPNNVWQTVKMTINVPKAAAFGYYYAVVFSRVGDDIQPDDRTNAIQGGTAVLVLLDARSPNAKRVVELDEFSSKHWLYEFLPGEFSMRLKNSGNVHAIPYGNVFITKGDKQIATLSINGERGNILPNSKRIYLSEWTDGFPAYKNVEVDGKVKLDKNGKPIRSLQWDLSKLTKIRFGKYTAQLFVVYDDGKRDIPIEAKLTFWVVPWRFLLVVLIIIILVGLGLYFSFKGTWHGFKRLGKRP